MRRVARARLREQHRQEVAAEAEAGRGLHDGQPAPVPERVRGERRRLRHDAVDLRPSDVLVEDRLRFGIVAGQCREARDEHAHRVRVGREPVEQSLDALGRHLVRLDHVRPARELCSRGQLAVQQQVRGFEVRARLGELLDRIAAVAQDAAIAVDERDAALHRGRVHQRRIVRHQAEVVFCRLDAAQLCGTDRPVGNGHFVGAPGAVVGECQRVRHARLEGNVSRLPAVWPAVSARQTRSGLRRVVGVRGLRRHRLAGDAVLAVSPAGEVDQPAAVAAERPERRIHRPAPAQHAQRRLRRHTGILTAISGSGFVRRASGSGRGSLACRRVTAGHRASRSGRTATGGCQSRAHPCRGSAASAAWCRTSRADTMKITSSATFVAWSPMRSRWRETRMRSSDGSMVEGSCSM